MRCSKGGGDTGEKVERLRGGGSKDGASVDWVPDEVEAIAARGGIFSFSVSSSVADWSVCIA
jgi:hypothetical protein